MMPYSLLTLREYCVQAHHKSVITVNPAPRQTPSEILVITSYLEKNTYSGPKKKEKNTYTVRIVNYEFIAFKRIKLWISYGLTKQKEDIMTAVTLDRL